MSVYLLDFFQPLPEAHTILDDRESFFWVILYMCYRFLKNTVSPSVLGEQLSSVFDSYVIADSGRVGTGHMKKRELGAIARGEATLFKSKVLNAILKDLARPFSARYQEENPQRERRYDRAVKMFGPDSGEPDPEELEQYWDIEAKKDLQKSEWLSARLRAASDELLKYSQSSNNTEEYQYHQNRIHYSIYSWDKVPETEGFHQDIGSLPFVDYI